MNDYEVTVEAPTGNPFWHKSQWEVRLAGVTVAHGSVQGPFMVDVKDAARRNAQRAADRHAASHQSDTYTYRPTR